MRKDKVAILVAPVVHERTPLPKEPHNPLTPGEVAPETLRAAEARKIVGLQLLPSSRRN